MYPNCDLQQRNPRMSFFQIPCKVHRWGTKSLFTVDTFYLLSGVFRSVGFVNIINLRYPFGVNVAWL